MRIAQLNLFDLLSASRRLIAPARPAPPKRPTTARAKSSRREGPMAQRYAHLTRELLAIHNVRVRKWRTSMSGVAWMIEYRDGTRSNLIEAPRPKGPMSAAVFCHEIGHHAIGLGAFTPRCLEEYHAWMWSLEAMRNYDIPVTQRVRERVHDSLHYAVQKAQRRGLKRLPDELQPYRYPREVRITIPCRP
ncbi:MAG: hypothetical protein KDA20_02810 [Phycisphaerales bacterium]|nr:hypothetical protein [Phycisphaerales bacterium]